MATWVPSALTADIRGLLGAQVFSFQRGVHYIKNHNPNPNQPRTAAQRSTQAHLSDLSAWWYHLSHTQQEMWHKFASLQKRPVTGYNAFLSVNLSLYCSGIPNPTRRDHPPLTPNTPTFPTNFNVTPTSPTQNTISWSTPNDAGLYVQTWKSYDWNYFSGYHKMWVIQSATLSTAQSYVHNHDTPTGARIWYRLRSIDLWGRKSPFTHTIKQTIPAT